MEETLTPKNYISDEIGFETLDSIAQANRFNEWMYKTISRDMEGKILEIGSGIGNISKYFVRDGFNISVSDMRPEYCGFLQQKFKGRKNFQTAHQIDIVDPYFDSRHKDLFCKFDAVFALNIIEHVDNDDLAIKNCLKLLKKGGRLVILVPAFMSLYNSFDEGLGHYRRYNRQILEELLVNNRLTILDSTYFNFAGVLGWWISGNILKKKTIPSGQMRLYNSLVWAFKIADFFLHRIIGLSVIVKGRK